LSNREDTPKVFQLADLILDQMPLLVEVRVDLTPHFVIGARRDDGFGVSPLEVQDESLGVIALVGNHILGAEVFDERFGLRDVVALAARQEETRSVT
jgi:hypothetical protein